ncbi:hypothetical protein JYK02_12670 [Corallococcus macrosporus]|uniref:Uncharacterized protein n=1 Tax=Corallococcus macrosporus TaxID=35 RepID=A0ABS3DD51_9BACT|nr:hypothetical protein [Corallococcus macrosporus]MBN8228355.1 hypothetical protein [Corallococcus macrosporus]
MHPFHFTCESLRSDTRQHRLLSAGMAVSWAAFAAGLRTEPALRSALSETLADCPYPAFFWETPAVSAAGTGTPFEMVLVSAPSLAGTKASPVAFAEQLQLEDRSGPEVRTFANLGGDATLVVPRAMADSESYGHLAAFVRAAPASQVHALWQAVGEALTAAWARGPAPVWLSTSGSGVPWLHVRLDARPKYYKHAPYRVRPAHGR